jgi:hypothetical protein
MIHLPVDLFLAFDYWVGLRFVFQIQSLTRLVQYFIQPLADRLLLAFLRARIPLDIAILVQRLPQPLLRIAWTPRFFVNLHTTFRFFPVWIVPPGDPCQPLPNIVRSPRATLLRCRRPERCQTGRDTPLGQGSNGFKPNSCDEPRLNA